MNKYYKVFNPLTGQYVSCDNAFSLSFTIHKIVNDVIETQCFTAAEATELENGDVAHASIDIASCIYVTIDEIKLNALIGASDP